MRVMEYISSLFHRKNDNTKNVNATADINYLLLSTQSALGDAIVPELRAVTIDFDEIKHEIILHFYYDCEVTDKLFDLASCASAEIDVNPEYPFFCTLNEDIAISLPYPQPIPDQGYLVYLRKEPILPKFTKKINAVLLQNEIRIVALQLLMQDALLGKVTPTLRIVTIDVNTDEKGLFFYFEYDCPISEDDRNLANSAVQEASASFRGYSIHSYIQPVGEATKKGKRAVYLRREPDHGKQQ